MKKSSREKQLQKDFEEAACCDLTSEIDIPSAEIENQDSNMVNNQEEDGNLLRGDPLSAVDRLPQSQGLLYRAIKVLMEDEHLSLAERFQLLKSSNKLVKKSISLKENFEQVLWRLARVEDKGVAFEDEVKKLCKHYDKKFQGMVRPRSNAFSRPARSHDKPKGPRP